MFCGKNNLLFISNMNNFFSSNQNAQRVNKYIVLQGGCVVYNGFLFADTTALVNHIFTENECLIFVEKLKVLEFSL